MTRARWFAWSVSAFIGAAGVACSALTSFNGLTGTEPDGAAAQDGGPVTPDASCAADLTTSANCGACGHDCFGGPCTQGACGPVPIATGLPGIGLVEVNGPFVAFAVEVDGGATSSIYAMQTDGGDLRVLLTQQDGPNYAASDRDHVYFSNFTGGEIQAVQWDGGRFATLTKSALVNQVLLTSQGIVFAAQGDGGKNGGLYLVDLGGTTTAPIVTGQVGPECVGEIDGGFVFTDFDNQGKSVIRVDDTGKATTLATGMSPGCLATDGTYAYWSDRLANAIQRTDVVSGMTTQLAVTGDSPGFVRIDGTYVYWMENKLGNVRRVRKDGAGMPEVLYGGNGAVSGLAVDERAVYFGLKTTGNVMKLAK